MVSNENGPEEPGLLGCDTCCWASSQLVQEVLDCLNLKMNALRSFGTSKTTRLTLHVPEDVGLHTTSGRKN
jgi:hypothetical protein